MVFLMMVQDIFGGAKDLLEYKEHGLIALLMILWFFERIYTTRRWGRILQESSKADLEVAKALQAVQTILTMRPPQ